MRQVEVSRYYILKPLLPRNMQHKQVIPLPALKTVGLDMEIGKVEENAHTGVSHSFDASD